MGSTEWLQPAGLACEAEEGRRDTGGSGAVREGTGPLAYSQWSGWEASATELSEVQMKTGSAQSTWRDS